MTLFLCSVRLQGLLPEFPAPFPSLQVVKPIGEGTFSTVYLVSRNDDYYPGDLIQNNVRFVLTLYFCWI
jgi:hypothetical protein